jgi:hypothetical protein
VSGFCMPSGNLGVIWLSFREVHLKGRASNWSGVSVKYDYAQSTSMLYQSFSAVRLATDGRQKTPVSFEYFGCLEHSTQMLNPFFKGCSDVSFMPRVPPADAILGTTFFSEMAPDAFGRYSITMG